MKPIDMKPIDMKPIDMKPIDRKPAVASALTILFGPLLWAGFAFAQSTPLSLSDANVGKLGSNQAGELLLPSGTKPFPAVIVTHGCDGVESHPRGWARRVTSWGYASLVIDSFRPRGVTQECEEQNVVPVTLRARDIAAGAAYLRKLSAIDPARIGVVGLSHGGTGALIAARAGEDGRTSEANLQAAVAYYPWCLRNPEPLATDLLIIIGEADDWTPSKRCVNLVARYRADAPRRPVLKVYPGAVHAFEIRAPDRDDFGHRLKYHPEAAADAIASTRKFLDERLRR
jgi:dienelactone hydrolase